MKSLSDQKTRRGWGRRAKKLVSQSSELATTSLPESAVLPEPPLLPDVYTKDHGSIHPRRRPPRPSSKTDKADDP
jgi:hypothetical protein